MALNDIEQKVKSMIQLSVDGMPSQYDSDSVEHIYDDTEDRIGSEVIDNNEGPSQVLSDHFTVFANDTEGIIVDYVDNEQGTEPGIGIELPIQQQEMTERTWGVVTPKHLNLKKSTPLRKIKQCFKSRSTEATNLLQNRNQLVPLQIKCLEQEVEINDLRKRNIILEEQKLKLEIQLLERNLKE